jgi:hypothetical protein
LFGRASRWEQRETVNGFKGALLTATEEGCAEQLARFFPQVAPVKIPAQVVAPRAGGKDLVEAVIVRFHGADHAIFLSTLPIEFNDPIRLVQKESGAVAEGSVVAVQYEEGRKALAVRFTNGSRAWVAPR